MQIKEVTERTGLTKKAIRYYEECGFIEPAKKENGYKNYLEEDIDVLLQIKNLRLLEFSVQEIKDYMAGNQQEVIRKKIEENNCLIEKIEAINLQLGQIQKEYLKPKQEIIDEKRSEQMQIVKYNWRLGIFSIIMMIVMGWLSTIIPYRLEDGMPIARYVMHVVVIILLIQWERRKKMRRLGNIVYEREKWEYILFAIGSGYSYLQLFGMISETWKMAFIMDQSGYITSMGEIGVYVIIIVVLVASGFVDSRKEDMEFS